MTPDEQAAKEVLRNYNETAPPTKNGQVLTPTDVVTPDGADTPKRKPDRLRTLIDTVKTACRLVHYAGHMYAVSKPSPWTDMFGPPGTAQMFGSPLRRRIVRLAGRHQDIGIIGSDIADKVMLNLEAEADEGPETPLSLRFCHRNDQNDGEVIYIDLGRTDGRCIEIRPSDWSVINHPPDGVIFRRSATTRELPVPVRGGNLNALAEILGFPPDSREFKLILGWMLALPFNSSVLPGLLLIGATGYGKSTRLRLTTSVWEPSPDDSLGSAFGRNYADDQVRALHRAVPLWDNLSRVSGDISDLLCCLITGTAIEGRKYYSNADLDRNPIRRAIGLTAVGMPAGLRPDALDRLIVVELPPLAHRVADAQVQDRFDRAHPALLGAACDAVAAALAGRALAPEPTQYRMAAYAGVLAALDAITAAEALPGCPGGLLDAYDATLRECRQRTAADDAFGGPLLDFMRRRTPKKQVGANLWETHWEGQASELRSALLSPRGVGSSLADTSAPGWPRSDRAVASCLGHLQDGLAELGLTWNTRTLHGRRLYMLTLRGGAEVWKL
jgi:hypothetical protein